MNITHHRTPPRSFTIEVFGIFVSAWWATLLWATHGALQLPSWKVLRDTAGGEAGVALIVTAVTVAQLAGLAGLLPNRTHRAVLLVAAAWWMFVCACLILAVPINTGSGVYAAVAGLNIAAYFQSRQ